MIIVYYPHGTWRIISFPKEDLEGDQRAVCGKILRGRGLDGENLLGQVMTGSPRSFRMIINHLEVGESTGEGNGTPLQYSCLENPMDGGAW